MASAIPTVNELMLQAEELGLVREDLVKFVFSQQASARDDRARERELEKAKLELECEERDKIRNHELELARLQQNSAAYPHVLTDKVSLPKLPVFKEGDDINAFLVRFERIAELLKFSEDSFAVRLGSLLTGRALEIYASLPTETTGNYRLLKLALLRGFNKTPETLRQDFRSLKIRPNETYDQFSVRLGRAFDLWLNSRERERTFDELRQFVLIDQFLASVSSDLRMYLKERNMFTLDEITELADN